MPILNPILLTGLPHLPPDRIPLRAGALTLIFDPAAGDLRYIRLNDREIVRRLYATVRNRHWATLPIAISDLNVQTKDDAFSIRFTARHALREIDFEWNGTIVGESSGRIRFDFTGLARSTFLRNRIGLCLLHPSTAAGDSFTIHHPDGTPGEGQFPRFISPHQPAFDIASFIHLLSPTQRVCFDFEGDTFEMEDQRNWLDASYKTYSTPLRLPMPVEVREGTRIRQAISVNLDAPSSAHPLPPGVGGGEGAPVEEKPVHVTLSNSSLPLPLLGLQITSSVPPTPIELSRLRALRLSHLRLNLDLSTNIEPDLALARQYTDATKLPLELSLTLPDTPDATNLLANFAPTIKDLPLARILLHQTNHPSTPPAILTAARIYLSDTPLVGGTDQHFTELNRNRLDPRLLDMLCYSSHPQAHAHDNRTMVENAATFIDAAETARSFAPNIPIAVTPITLKGHGKTVKSNPNELPPSVDPRQLSLFAAAWTASALKHLTDARVHSATFYQTLGWLGLMERETGSPLPDLFPSTPGAVFPLYHVLADLGDFRGGHALRTTSSDPLRVECLALKQDDKLRFILANMTHNPQDVIINDLSADFHVRTLDQHSAEDACAIPGHFRVSAGSPLSPRGGQVHLTLSPHAVLTFTT